MGKIYRRTRPSLVEVARSVPSGLKAISRPLLPAPGKVSNSAPLSQSQTLTVPSKIIVATWVIITSLSTIDGGTGRFADAQGEYMATADYNLVTDEGDFEFEGWISY